MTENTVPTTGQTSKYIANTRHTLSRELGTVPTTTLCRTDSLMRTAQCTEKIQYTNIINTDTFED